MQAFVFVERGEEGGSWKIFPGPKNWCQKNDFKKRKKVLSNFYFFFEVNLEEKKNREREEEEDDEEEEERGKKCLAFVCCQYSNGLQHLSKSNK